MKALVIHRSTRGHNDYPGAGNCELLRKYAESRGWTVDRVIHFQEEVPSRQSITVHDGPDVVVVLSLARACPSTPAALRWVSDLLVRGIHVVSKLEGLDTTAWREAPDLLLQLAAVLSSTAAIDTTQRTVEIRAGQYAGNRPARHRVALDLETLIQRWENGLSQRDIARSLTVGEASVSPRSVRRALRRLQRDGALCWDRRLECLWYQGFSVTEIRHRLGRGYPGDVHQCLQSLDLDQDRRAAAVAERRQRQNRPRTDRGE